MKLVATAFATALLSVMPAFSQSASMPIHGRDHIALPAPPPTQAVPVTDDYFGNKITDPYRWLEDSKSPDTRAFLDQQIAYTDRYLKQARVRPELADSLDALIRVTTWSTPIQRGNLYFFSKRFASEEQASIYLRKGWPAPGAQPSETRLVDPATLSKDPNTSVSIADVSHDGSLLAYSVRQGGADEGEIHFLTVSTAKPLEDVLPSGRYMGLAFAPDHSGIYYSLYTPKGCLVSFHRFGTRNSADTLLFGREFHAELLGPLDLVSAQVTDDGHYLVLSISRGVPAKREDIVYRDLRKPDAPFKILVWGFDSRFSAAYANGDFLVLTDYNSPRGRILKANPGVAPEAWQTIVPEGPDVIESFNLVGNKIFVNTLHDVISRTAIYTLAGKPAGSIAYATLGSASTLSGELSDRYGYFSFQSFIQPPTIYRYDTVTGKQDIFAQPKIPFDASQFELKQDFYTSKDGTRIPIFIAGKKGLKRDGSERLLMTAYGGFNVSETPAWSPLWAAWLQQGGYFALPSLRGGGEYGESWHQAGMFGKKQNVFDDFFAAADFLIAQHYTTSDRFAISGRSNGGLLMGAAITQRPQTFSAIWCGYPLLDMLRYQNFLVGRFWTTEYGSAENRPDYNWLRAYSPYHNVTPGTAYPAIMLFTGDSDTRVDPLHARKMTPLLQSASTSGRPILLHYSLKGGHSAGVAAQQLVEDYADQLAFLWTETGPK